MSLPANQQAPLSAPAGELTRLASLAVQQAEQIGLLRRENNILSRHLLRAMERISALEEQLDPKPARAGYETVTADPDWGYLLSAIEAADEDPLLAMVGAPVERWTELCPIDAEGKRCLQGWLQLWTLEEPRTSRIGWWYEDPEIQETMTAASMPFDRMCERYGIGAVVEACRCAGWTVLEQIWSERRAA